MAAAPGLSIRIPYLGTTLPPQSVMNRYFGPLNSTANETVVNFAGHSVQINRVLAENLRQAGRAVAAAGLAGEIRDVGGFRTTVGGSGSPIPFSMHQYGAAFDINEDGGPNGDWHTMTLDPRLVRILASYHWFCGENWSGASRDGGHFQFTGGTRVPYVRGVTAPLTSPGDSSAVALRVLVLLGAAVVVIGGGVVLAGVLLGRLKGKPGTRVTQASL